MAPRTNEPKTIRVEDLVRVPPELAGLDVEDRVAYWRVVGTRALSVKKAEVLEGIGAGGEPLLPVRRREGGPPLVPHRARSRTYRLLALAYRADGASLYWRGGGGRTTWPVIMGYHAYRHGPRSLPVRNTIGISPGGTQEVMAESEAWRAGYEAGRKAALREVITGKGGKVKVSPKDLVPRVRKVAVKEVKVEREARERVEAEARRKAEETLRKQQETLRKQEEAKRRAEAEAEAKKRAEIEARIARARAMAEAREAAEREARAREAVAEERRQRRPYHAATEAIRAAHEKQREETAKAMESATSFVAGVHHKYPDLVPSGPIAKRIEQYHVGEAKRQEVIRVARGYKAERDRLERQANDVSADFYNAHAEMQYLEAKIADPGLAGAKRQALVDRLAVVAGQAKVLRDNRVELRARQEAHAEAQRRAVADVLRVADPIAVGLADVAPGATNMRGQPLQGGVAGSGAVTRAREFVERLTARTDTPGIAYKIGQGPGYRAHHSKAGGYIQVDPHDKADVVVHELGHALEAHVTTGGRTVGTIAQEFLAHRVGNETPIDMHAKFKTGDPGEMGRKDKFGAAFSEYDAYYIGKDYGRDATEIISMGLQKLWSDAAGLAERDPEYFKLITGILDGSLR